MAAVVDVAERRASCIEDLTSNMTPTAAILARTCSQALRDRPAIALSFDPAALRHMREELPSLPLGLLTWLRFPIGQAVAAAAHLDVQVLAVHAGSLWRNAVNGHNDVPSVQRVVDLVHDADRELAVWCPSERRVKALAAAGVDALVVDNVSRHARAVAQVRARDC
jgi:glycerophosphoryl diester phosphodiesterase